MSFIVDQLDGPHTLRPSLARLFRIFLDVLGGPASAALVWRRGCLLAILLPPALACLNFWRPQFSRSGPLSIITRLLTSRGMFLASILLAMTVIRLPSLLLSELNVDESQFIASAQKLTQDPIFFRSVDCGTVGPVDIYPLTLPRLFGLTPDYASSRLVGLAIMFCSLWILYLAFVQLAGDRIARIALLPLMVILATIQGWDFQHYASEVPTLILVAGALYCTIRIHENIASSAIWFAGLGMLTSLSCFSKIQSLPLLITVAIVALSFTWLKGGPMRWRSLGWLSAAAAIPFAVNAIVSAGAGVWDNFWNAYIVANMAYANNATQGTLAGFPKFVLATPEVLCSLFVLTALTAGWLFQKTPWWRRCTNLFTQCLSLFAVSAAVLFSLQTLKDRSYLAILGIAAAFVALEVRSLLDRREEDSRAWFSVLVFFLISSAMVAVYLPHRPYAHYLFLVLIPIGAGIAGLLLRQPFDNGGPLRQQTLAFLFLFITVNVLASLWLVPSAMRFREDFSYAQRSIRSPEGDFVRSISPPGGSLVVWGWEAKLYLSAGILPATRDTNMRNFFESTDAVNTFYRRRFLAAVTRSPPEVLVDAAVARNQFLDQRYRIESVPEVAAYVAQNYTLVDTDSNGRRYFVRNDLPATLVKHLHCSANAIRCFDAIDIAAPATLPPVAMSSGAFLDIGFTPEGPQQPNTTVFSNTESSGSGVGVELQCLGSDEYRLAVGLGDGHWAFSRPLRFPPNMPARLGVEFRPLTIIISSGVGQREVMTLPKPMPDSAAPIRLRSRVRRRLRFLGTINLFEVRPG